MDQNEEIFIRFMNDAAFGKLVTAELAFEAYQELRRESFNSPKGLDREGQGEHGKGINPEEAPALE